MPTLYSLVIDNDGCTTTQLFYTETARDARCHAICSEAWADIEAESGTLIGMPDDWREAYAILDERGCDFWLSLFQHEIDIAQLVA